MTTKSSDGRTVFVAHGRNLRARDIVCQFLRAVGLRPLEWLSMLTEIGPSPTIEQIVADGIQKADAIVVVLTGDDEVRLRAPLVGPHDTDEELQFRAQARPNVLFELGLALAVAPARTLIIQIGDVKSLSDIAGRHILRMNNSKKHELAQRLRAAGCAVDTSGEDWLNTGDFEELLVHGDDWKDLVQAYQPYLDMWSLLPFTSPGGALSTGLVEQHMIGLSECILRSIGDSADDVMREIRHRITLRPDLKQKRLPICLVTDSAGRLAGIVTPSDLLAKYLAYHDQQDATVEHVWTANPWVLDASDTVGSAVRRIAETGVLSGLPVTRDQLPVGYLPHPGRRELVG